MAKNETTVKISKWLLNEVESYVDKTPKNRTEFPSKKNFVDKAVITYLEEKGVVLK
jgi:metal-responsive CopG/Arc/MetJ family transcriptional regulator